MTLQDALNKISVPGHTGPHSPLYHQYILDSLQSATDGLSGLAFRQALQKELIELGREVVSNPAILDGMGLE
jgi:hypothetical protein